VRYYADISHVVVVTLLLLLLRRVLLNCGRNCPTTPRELVEWYNKPKPKPNNKMTIQRPKEAFSFANMTSRMQAQLSSMGDQAHQALDSAFVR
jgi:hypothetical protein